MLGTLSMTVCAVSMPVFDLMANEALLALKFVAVGLGIAYQVFRIWRHFRSGPPPSGGSV